MKIEDTLFIIFSIDVKRNMNRFIETAYTTKGILNLAELSLAGIDEGITHENNRLGPFETMDSLTKFSYSLSDKQRLASVCLCSSEAVNRAFIKIANISELNNALLEEGEILENPDNKKNGIFGNFLR